MNPKEKETTTLDKLCHTLYQVGQACDRTHVQCRRCGHELLSYYCEERLYLIVCPNCKLKCLVSSATPTQACKASIGGKSLR